MSELIGIGEQIIAAEQARIAQGDAALAVAEVREALPQVLVLLQSMTARLAGVEAQIVELTRITAAPRERRPVRDANNTILYVVDELAAEEG